MKKFRNFIKDVLLTPYKFLIVACICTILLVLTIFLPFINLSNDKVSKEEYLEFWRKK